MLAIISDSLEVSCAPKISPAISENLIPSLCRVKWNLFTQNNRNCALTTLGVTNSIFRRHSRQSAFHCADLLNNQFSLYFLPAVYPLIQESVWFSLSLVISDSWEHSSSLNESLWIHKTVFIPCVNKYPCQTPRVWPPCHVTFFFCYYYFNFHLLKCIISFYFSQLQRTIAGWELSIVSTVW